MLLRKASVLNCDNIYSSYITRLRQKQTRNAQQIRKEIRNNNRSYNHKLMNGINSKLLLHIHANSASQRTHSLRILPTNKSGKAIRGLNHTSALQLLRVHEICTMQRANGRNLFSGVNAVNAVQIRMMSIRYCLFCPAFPTIINYIDARTHWKWFEVIFHVSFE